MYEINHDTFKRLWEEHFRPLVYLCRKYKVDNEAEDIVSDKFTKLWELRTQFESAEKVKAFLYVSVMNAIKNEGRLRGRIVELDYDDDVAMEELEAFAIKHIYDEIQKLPPVCRKVFIMKILYGMSNNEICRELNRAYNTVDNQYQRAKQLLRKRIRYEL